MLHAFYQKHTKHIKNITWSQLNHSSLSWWSTVCTRQDLESEHSILRYGTLTLNVYHICHCVGRCVKYESCSYQAYEFLLGYVTILTNVRCYYRVVYNNFVFQQDGALLHLAFKTVHCCSAKLSTSFFLRYGPITVQSLFRESYSSMSMSCK